MIRRAWGHGGARRHGRARGSGSQLDRGGALRVACALAGANERLL